VTLRIFEPVEGETVVRVGDTTFTVSVSGGAIQVERDGPALPWRVSVAGGPSADVDASQAAWTA
jgi:alpha-D-xyloside xylohydrolase